MNDVPKRRWLRFSLKTFFLFTTLLCVWLASQSIRVHKQRRALDQIQKLGGSVGFDFQLDAADNWKSNRIRLAPRWMRDAIGEDYFRRVAILNFDEGSNPTDADLALLTALPDLRELTLADRRNITDAGLVHLAQLRDLRVLDLKGTLVIGPGLRHLQSLSTLEGLSLANSPLTDEGLQFLTHLSNLRWLHLSSTNISDDGLRYVSSLRRLQDLQLVNANVTDVGLNQLKSLSQLKRILLYGTNVTHEGVEQFQKDLPACQISWP
jgi:hypothetical protein